MNDINITTPCQCGHRSIVRWLMSQGRYSSPAEIPVSLHWREAVDLRCGKCNRLCDPNPAPTAPTKRTE